MTMLWLCMIYFWLRTSHVASQGYYKVTGPKEIRPNSEYHAAISVQGTSVPIFLDVIIEGKQSNGRRYRTEETIKATPYSTKVVTLQIGDIPPGNYSLSLAGRSGFNLFSSNPLKYVRKSYSVLIQTDREIYNPGGKILFRAIILNPQLRPSIEHKNGQLDVFITDADGNIVKSWTNVRSPRGVFTEELLLSNSPVLGNWNISVSIQDQIYNKTIEVAKYILPKFIIEIDAPKYVTFKENIIIVHIESHYNYGKKVVGDATVTVYPTIFSGIIQPIFQTPVRKVVRINGSATVEFDIANELLLSDEYERTVVIDVTIEEALTGRRQNNSVEVHIHKYPYKMEIIKTSDYYKPGLQYTAFIKVTNQDNTLIQDRSNKVKIKYGFSRIDEVYKEEEYSLDRNGIIKLQLDTPSDSTNTTALRIDAQYIDLKERMPPVPAAISFSNTFLQVSLLTEKIVVGLGATVLVNCTESLKYINYEIYSRGDLIQANTHQVQDRKEFKFHFTAVHAMVPIAHLLVNYVREDGELIADSIDIEVEGLLQNMMEIQLSRIETLPDSEVDITFRTEPNSYIGLLAIDENAAKLKSGYDVTRDRVYNELLNYDGSNLSPYWAVMKDTMSHFFWKSGSSNVKDTYQDSSVILLTNSIVTSFRPTLEDIYLRPVFYEGSTVKPDRGVGLPISSVTRPPLAGPYAFSRIPRPVWNNPKVYLTHDIENTWLFTNFSSGPEGKTSIHRKIPSKITTWQITSFSLDPVFGLGITKSPKKIEVSKNCIIKFDLPSSIQRGEILTIPVVVYNNLENNLVTEITLHNLERNFEFYTPPTDKDDSKRIEVYQKKKILVDGNSAAITSFTITPLKIGWTEIKLIANSPTSQDTAIKHLLVKAEGETENYSKTMFIDLRSGKSYKNNVTLDLPKNAVPGSEEIEVSVVGDLLGPSMINLENLIRLPISCGEQNIVHMMPDIIILKYLRNTYQLTPTIEKEAIRNLEIGYQSQLSYKRNDGSFSAFGERDQNGSIWITAYTVLALEKAKKYIYIDENVIKNALQWINTRKNFDGSFTEIGPIIYHEMQGDSLALTAFVVLTFIEVQDPKHTYLSTIDRGLDYIARNIDEDDDVFTIAICSYVLQRADHPFARNAFNLLDSKAKTGNNTKWWAKDITKKEKNSPWNYLPKSIDIETTAYGLLTFIKAGRLEDAFPALNWLVQQQNNMGGFTSSQDTVMGLYAIYKLITKLSAKPNMDIRYSYTQQTGKFRINENTAMIVQRAKLGGNVRYINVTAEGSGIALFRVFYRYNMNVTGPWPLFTLDPQVDKNSNNTHLQLSICTAFVSSNLVKRQESNMAVMEVNLPSGFTADVDSLPSLEVSQNVQKVETRNGDTTVILYFNNLTAVEYCPTVSAFRTHKVANQKPVPVVVYDYYDSSRRARVFYKGVGSTFCDICEEDCENYCTRAQPQLPPVEAPTKSDDSGTTTGNNSAKEEGGGSNIISGFKILILLLLIFPLRI